MSKQVVLLVGLGSPNALSTSAIKGFLARFLTDAHVVKLPRILWYPLLYGCILPLRSRRLLKQYRQIWLNNAESPLIYYTKQQAAKLAQLIGHDDLVIRYAFSYAYPKLDDILAELHVAYGDTLAKLTVIPLYPQFSSTTSLAVFDTMTSFYSAKYYVPRLNFINDFHTHPLYIKAVADTIRQHWQNNDQSSKLIFSYHSLPMSVIQQGDPYYQQCLTTTKLIVSELGLEFDDYRISFQSKFGRQKWLSPTTVTVLRDLAHSGVSAVAIVCPGFISDCLETLEEVATRYKKVFLLAGGTKYEYIHCLNDSASAIDLLRSLTCVA